jgi:hypothetical protein
MSLHMRATPFVVEDVQSGYVDVKRIARRQPLKVLAYAVQHAWGIQVDAAALPQIADEGLQDLIARGLARRLLVLVLGLLWLLRRGRLAHAAGLACCWLAAGRRADGQLVVQRSPAAGAY